LSNPRHSRFTWDAHLRYEPTTSSGQFWRADIADWREDQSQQTHPALSFHFVSQTPQCDATPGLHRSVSRSPSGVQSSITAASFKKNEQCDGGRAPLLAREEGNPLAVGTTPGGGGVPGAAGVGDPLADHARTGGVAVTRSHNAAAAKSKLSVETPNWTPGQPRRGALLPIHSTIWHSTIWQARNRNASIRKTFTRRLPTNAKSLVRPRHRQDQLANEQRLSFQSPTNHATAVASGQATETLGNPSAFTGLSGDDISENTHCVGSPGVAL